MNKEYEIHFQEAKKEFLIRKDVSIEAIEATYENISDEDIILLNEYNKTAIKALRKVEQERGLCVPLSVVLLRVSAIILKQRYAYLTLGKIIDTNNNNDIFNVGTKEDCIKRITNNTVLGGDIHAWITLSDGTIIDPSIKSKDAYDNKMLFGSPLSLSDEYRYIPYYIYEIIEVEGIVNHTKYKDDFEKELVVVVENFKKI